MKLLIWRRFFIALLAGPVSFGMTLGCDSGKEVVDEVTGNRAVKQYKRTKERIEKIEDQQAQRYDSIPDDEKKDDER